MAFVLPIGSEWKKHEQNEQRISIELPFIVFYTNDAANWREHRTKEPT